MYSLNRKLISPRFLLGNSTIHGLAITTTMRAPILFVTFRMFIVFVLIFIFILFAPFSHGLGFGSAAPDEPNSHVATKGNDGIDGAIRHGTSIATAEFAEREIKRSKRSKDSN